MRGAMRWCRRRESNSRPHPYQGCALPLSHGGTKNSSEPCHRRIVLARGGGKLYDSCVSEIMEITKENKERSLARGHVRESALARALRENILKRKAQKSARYDKNNTATKIEEDKQL
jgi:hypothetical protein